MITAPPLEIGYSVTLKGRILVFLIILLASIFPLNLFSHEQPQPVGVDGQLSGRQGEVLLVTVPVNGVAKSVTGKFLRRNIGFFPMNDSQYGGLLGLDMQANPGQHELKITVQYPDRSDHKSVNVLVMKEDYPVQNLKLPKKMVDLDKKTLARVKAESKAINQAFSSFSAEPLWSGTFIEPVQGRVSGRFGSRRVINGQPRRPHSGEDIAAPEGTPVAAMNGGIVRLTMDHFFTGKGVILDHGLGLFSMYFHLSAVDVDQGQTVEKGQVIGKVGATGRATGAHLHWGVRLNNSRINPYSLINLAL